MPSYLSREEAEEQQTQTNNIKKAILELMKEYSNQYLKDVSEIKWPTWWMMLQNSWVTDKYSKEEIVDLFRWWIDEYFIIKNKDGQTQTINFGGIRHLDNIKKGQNGNN